MSREHEVDDLLAGFLLDDDEALAAALRASAAAGLPPADVSPLQGRLLQLLARLAGARAILELGTLGGYSTIWLARALPPGGHLVSLELEPAYAEVARANVARAGLADRVEIRIGPAADGLAQLAAEGAGPFDVVFVDADKRGNAGYVRGALELSRPGTLIVVDNVVRGGAILDADSDDPSVRGVHELLELRPRRAPPVGDRAADGRDQGLGRPRPGHRGRDLEQFREAAVEPVAHVLCWKPASGRGRAGRRGRRVGGAAPPERRLTPPVGRDQRRRGAEPEATTPSLEASRQADRRRRSRAPPADALGRAAPPGRSP